MVDSSEGAARQGQEASVFYRRAMRLLYEADVPFLVGGAYALGHYAGITRRTKDLDLFLRRGDLEEALHAFDAAGIRAEAAYAHWLAKAFGEGTAVDLIYRSGNGVMEVDDAWFEHAVDDEVLGMEVQLCPLEEMLWMKAYIMERERYDGSDVAHLLRSSADRVDWPRLLDRFGPHWRVLLSHLILFGFIYPSERNRIPQAVVEELLQRWQAERRATPPAERVCQGTLLSRTQYLVDVEQEEYQDARLCPRGAMGAEEIRAWTQAIDEEDRPQGEGKSERR